MYLVLKMITLIGRWICSTISEAAPAKEKKTSNTAQIRKYLKQWEAHQNQALSRNWYGSW